MVLAKNDTGYRNLVKLTSISHLRGMRGQGIFARACIDKHLLQQYSEGLIVATACLGGEMPQAILRGRPDVAAGGGPLVPGAVRRRFLPGDPGSRLAGRPDRERGDCAHRR